MAERRANIAPVWGGLFFLLPLNRSKSAYRNSRGCPKVKSSTCRQQHVLDIVLDASLLDPNTGPHGVSWCLSSPQVHQHRHRPPSPRAIPIICRGYISVTQDPCCNRGSNVCLARQAFLTDGALWNCPMSSEFHLCFTPRPWDLFLS